MIDSRFHLAVAPSLEYKFSDIALAARDALVGDTTADTFRELCATYMKSLRRKRQAFRSGNGTLSKEATAPMDAGLDKARNEVCKTLEAYLVESSRSWKLFVHNMYTSLNHQIPALKKSCGDTGMQPERVIELRASLDALLQEIRLRPPPAQVRPRALSQSVETLRDAFTSLTQTRRIPTASVLQQKELCEACLFSVEYRIARDFVEHMLTFFTPGSTWKSSA